MYGAFSDLASIDSGECKRVPERFSSKGCERQLNFQKNTSKIFAKELIFYKVSSSQLLT